MPPEFRKDEHHLQRLRVAELARPGVRHVQRRMRPTWKPISGRTSPAASAACSNRPVHMLGRSTQVLPNNWKLYFENVKDTYHASILHLFLTTFRINRLSQPGGININRQRRQPFQLGQARLRGRGRRLQGGGAARRQRIPACRTARSSSSVDEYGDSVSVQILTVFPGMVLQQIRNTIAVRVLRPRGRGPHANSNGSISASTTTTRR